MRFIYPKLNTKTLVEQARSVAHSVGNAISAIDFSRIDLHGFELTVPGADAEGDEGTEEVGIDATSLLEQIASERRASLAFEQKLANALVGSPATDKR